MKNTIKGATLVLFMLIVAFSAEAQKTKQKSSTVIKLITTKQYNEPYDLVYKSMMSLMHSQQYMIEITDYDTGLILVKKNIHEKRKSYFRTGQILVDQLNEGLTEVKLSMYIGASKTNSNGMIKRVESMSQDPEFYNKWFNDLYLEIQRRKALR
tara:strand:+ start:462 stop:923 length:462 start_codon:yes stop_codon:yes gene_type:complete